jgi:SAM-dependent methyltransferase
LIAQGSTPDSIGNPTADLRPTMTWNVFTWLSDIRFWVRSARSDAQLQRFRSQHDNAQSLDLLYEERKDPWGLDSPHFHYQQIKYATMLSLLPRRDYKRALDLGCGLGNLTRRLRNHADQVLGIDVSHVAVAQATRETTEGSNLQFQQGDALNLSRDLNNGFDLVVIADTLYYLSPLSDDVLQAVRERVAQLLVPGGILLLVNHFTVHLDPGSRWSPKIHRVFRSARDFATIYEGWRPFYLASIFEKSL